jgi:tagatose 6-phosphate kinase
VTELVEEHAAVTPTELNRLLKRCQAHMAGGKCGIVVLSGSLPPGADPGFYRRVMEVARRHKLPVLLDGRGKPLQRALPLGGFITKFNRAELAETVGDPLRTDAAFKKAMRQVCPAGGAICITMGKHGAAAFDGKSYWRISTPAVRAINPIGSGDAFAAGLAAVLEKGGSFADGCKLGSACGAANALTKRAGVAESSVVQELLKKVEVTKWGN